MMGLTDFNLTPKAKKGLKDAKKFAEANGHTLVTTEHLIYGCLVNLSDSCSLKLKGYGVPLEQKEFIKTSDSEELSAKKFEGRHSYLLDLSELLSIIFKTLLIKLKAKVVLPIPF